MQFLTLSLLATLAAGSPISAPAPQSDVPNQMVNLTALETVVKDPAVDGVSIRNDLENGTAKACPRSILVFSRGTNEVGNLGNDVGVPLATSLESFYGKSSMWVQGVGGPYKAELPQNLLPDGASKTDINEAVRLLNEANSKCPSSTLVAGGYSQGAALMAAAVSQLSAPVMSQLKGVVLFGYTKNKQNNASIPNFPVAKTKIFCNPGDLVCDGTLIILEPHLQYGPVAMNQGPQYLEGVIGPASKPK